MRAITLTQPWAQLVAIGAKQWETRSWPTKYRGPIAIHAAKGFPKWAQSLCWQDRFGECLDEGVPLFGNYPPDQALGLLPRGAVIAIAEIADCEPTAPNDTCAVPAGGIYPITAQEKAFGDYSPGRYAWRLISVRKLWSPIPAKGALGLWEWMSPADLEERLV